MYLNVVISQLRTCVARQIYRHATGRSLLAASQSCGTAFRSI